MRDKKEILILFDGPHLAYSPTTIQLYDELSKKYKVTIIAQDPNNYTGNILEGRNIVYYKYYNVKTRYFYLILFKVVLLFNATARAFKTNGLTYKDYFFRFLCIKKYIQSKKFKRIICIDIANLFFTSILNAKVDFLSLEISKDEHLLPLINDLLIDCVIIQSAERYNYIFKNKKHATFYVQNAPTYHSFDLPVNRKTLIYSGAANDVFGFYHCLNYLKKYKEEKLVVQGAILPDDRKKINADFTDLINEKRLILSDKYIDNKDVIKFLSHYEIGICFYNFDHPYVKGNYFNYISAPSGKMFKYLAAGVPVVASNISGFNFVNNFQCGILIKNINDTNEIHEAILIIRKDYTHYVKNALKAAENFSFDKAIEPYLDFISAGS